MVAGHVFRRAGADLPVQLGLVVDVIEDITVFPAEPVERMHRQHRDVFRHLAAGQRIQFLERGRIGDHGRPRIEDEALVFVDIGAPARLVALFQDKGVDALRTQANRRRKSAESAADNDGFHFTIL